MIFTILGTDHYQVSQKLKELKSGFIQKKDKAGLNVVNLDGEILSLAQFQQETLTTPFLSEKKMIVVTNILNNKKIVKEVVGFLKDNLTRIDNNICFVDFIDGEKNKVDRKNKLILTGELFKYLMGQKYVWEFNLIKKRDLNNWLKKYAEQNTIKLEASAISELTIKVGNDLWQLTSELDKLSAYKNGGPITAEDVKLIVVSKFDDNIFGLVDALGNQDKKTALRLITQQLNFGTHVLMILSMIMRQFKLLLKTKDDKSSALKLKINPFIFGKIKNQGKNFTPQQLIIIINELLELEKKIKSGEKNPELLLNLFITKNC